MLAEALAWKYGHVAATAGGKITAWRHPSLPQPNEVEVQALLIEYRDHMASVLFQKKRAADYEPIGDQLDRITKVFKRLKEAGVDIGPEGEAQINMVDAVKAKHPKPKS